MNQNIKKFIPAILGITATFFSFLSFIFIIVLDGDVWNYLNGIFSFIAIGGLLAIVVLDCLNIRFNKRIYFIPLGVIALAELFTGLEALIEIGSAYSSARYAYFNSFIDSIITILVIALFVYSIYKSKHILTAISGTYLAAHLFATSIYAFFQMFFAIFADNKFKYGINNFSTNLSLFLFYAIYFYLVYENHKSNNN